MLTSILGGLVGFLGSAVPELFKYFKEKEQRKHELQMFELQMKYADQMAKAKIQELETTADIKEAEVLHIDMYPPVTGWKYADALINAFTSFVRPSITYAFFGMYLCVKLAGYSLAVQNHGAWQDAVKFLWTESDMGIFCAIIAYWFGTRAMMKFFPTKK